MRQTVALGISILRIGAWLVALAVIAAHLGCASTPTVPHVTTLPPRPPHVPFYLGVTFAPFTEDEWAHVSDRGFLWRVEADQAADVISHGQAALLLAVTESDASVQALLPSLPKAWGIELGNEPNFAEDCQSVNAWYRQTVLTLRTAGWKGPILTAGIGNINDDTLAWAQCSIAGLPPDVWFAWHGYDAWRTQTATLVAMLKGRPHAMTEWGIPVSADEHTLAPQVTADLQTLYDSGSITAIWYQLHDGPPGTKDATFGLRAYDGHWRPTDQALAWMEAQ